MADTDVPAGVAEGNAHIRKKICLKQGHRYTQVADSDHRTTVGADTHIHRTFVCGACGDSIRLCVAVWQNWKPSPRKP